MSSEIDTIGEALKRQQSPPYRRLAELADPDIAVRAAMVSEAGRHWLRSLEDLTTELADELLEHVEDFRTSRRDSTLGLAVDAASSQAIVQNARAIASGPAAARLWRRLAADPDQLAQLACDIVSGGDSSAAENTLYLLTLDPLDPYEIGPERRAVIARAGLHSTEASIRTLAAEYLFDLEPAALAGPYQELIHDADERVRALAWSAAIGVHPQQVFELAVELVGQEAEDLEVRRSALAAIGTHFPTSQVVDLLAYFVAHPEPRLAIDAGHLLYRLHRHPVIATAAASSPHPEVREIGEFLLDPYRGSPAAGGSRPGDPTRSDIFAELIRQTEERMLDDEDRLDPRES